MLWLLLSACPVKDKKTVRSREVVPDEMVCPLDFRPVRTDGALKLALLVGVADYEHSGDSLPDLQGPAVDLKTMYRTLTGPLEVPARNICALEDGDARLEDFLAAFQARLVDHAEADSTVYIYFSGHGTQHNDLEGREVDGRDEVLAMHDYSPQTGAGGLIDDDFEALLSTLHSSMGGEAPEITVMIDACFAGTATRDTLLVERRIQPLLDPAVLSTPTVHTGSLDESLDGLTVLSASRDDTVALEPAEEGGGLFTESLSAALYQSAGRTWRQVALETARILRASLGDAADRQIPTFQGDLDRPVVRGAQAVSAAWEVIEQDGQTLTLSGAPMPGWGEGATIRIVPADTTIRQLASPLLPRVLATVTAYEDVGATAELEDATPIRPIQRGDKAVLVAPAARDDARLPVALIGLSEADTETLTARGERFMVPVSAGARLSVEHADGAWVIRDPEGRVRNRPESLDETARWLRLHAEQHALLSAAETLSHDGVISARAVPYPEQDCCGGWWDVCPGTGEQVLPACALWQIEVRGDHTSATDYQVGGALLTSDGCILGLPDNNEHITIESASTTRLDADWAMLAERTGEAPHHLLLFGYPVETPVPVPWGSLTTDCTDGPPELLGTRGAALRSDWTATVLTLKVSANPHLEPDACPASCGAEQTCTPEVDIRPFLPTEGHPLREIFASLDAAGGDPLAAVSVADPGALPACGSLEPGDLVRLDAQPALVVSAEVPLLWGADGFVVLDRSVQALTDCRRPEWPALELEVLDRYCEAQP